MSYTRQFVGHGAALLAEMPAICEWLRTNGVEPNHVPLNARVTFDRRHVSIDVHLTRDGHKYVEGDEIAAGVLTVPIRRRPPVLASLGPATRTRAGGTT